MGPAGSGAISSAALPIATPAKSVAPASQEPGPVKSTLRHGSVLGRYELLFELGSGGMATVFLARAHDVGETPRFVAIKCLQPDLGRDPRYAEMFFDEARITARISHPHVCNVLDEGEADGTRFLVLEYVAGETLASVRHALARQLESMPCTHHAGVVARIIADACEGLHAAHELIDWDGEPLEVVHRDVSPENVFLTYDGAVKVFDFGVALDAQQRHRTRTGVVKGKLSYIQPEVLHGHKPDRRADIWGLGVVAWELLTARRLFAYPSDAETLRAICDAEIAPPSSFVPDLPAALDAIVLRALDRDPAKRFATAREMGRQLTRFLAEQRLAIGMPELSELMDELFPSGRASKRQLLEIARQLEAAPVVVEAEVEPSKEVVVSVSAEHTALARPAPIIAVPRSGPRARRLAWIALVSVIAAMLAGAWGLSRPRSSEAATPAPAPAPLVVEQVMSDEPTTLSCTPGSALEVQAVPGDRPNSIRLRVSAVPEP